MESSEEWEIFLKASKEIEENYLLEVEKNSVLLSNLDVVRERSKVLEDDLNQEQLKNLKLSARIEELTKELGDYANASTEIEKNYHLELEKNKLSLGDLDELNKDLNRNLKSKEVEFQEEKSLNHSLTTKLLESENKADILEFELENERLQSQRLSSSLLNNQKEFEKFKSKFVANIKILRQETEKMKSVYPIHDLWVAKQLEVDRVRRAYKLIYNDHPERAIVESIIRFHEIEKDELKWLLDDAESRFQDQLKSLDEMWVEDKTFEVTGSVGEKNIEESASARESIARAPEF